MTGSATVRSIVRRIVRSGATVLLPVAFASSGSAQALRYPAAPRADQVDLIHDLRVSDPFRWAEDVRSPASQAWIARQRALTDSVLSTVTGRSMLRARIASLANHLRTRPRVRAGERLFLFESGGLDDPMVVYVRDDENAWPRVLLDLSVFDSSARIRLTLAEPSPDGRFLAYGVARDGSDWEEYRVIDVRTGEHLADTLRGIKGGSPAWTRDGRGFFYERFDLPTRGAPHGADRGHRVFYHVAGRPQEQDQLIYERPDHPAWLFRTRVSDDGRYAVIHVSEADAPNTRIYFIDLDNPRRPRISAPVVRLLDRADAAYDFVGSSGDLFYVRTDRRAARGRLVGIDVNAPDEGRWKTVIPERMDVLIDARFAGGGLVLHYLREGRSILQLTARDGSRQQVLPLPSLSVVTGLAARESESEIYFTAEGLASPPLAYRYSAESRVLEPLHAPKWTVDPNAYATSVSHVRTGDGRTMPMVLSRRITTPRDSSRPVLLIAPSGSGAPTLHRYMPALVAWMDMGGVVAAPLVRGTMDLGRSWYDAGIGPRRQAAVDDLILAAEHLTAQREGAPGPLVLLGQEHGAVLAAAAAAQRPALFGALVAIDPIADLVRFPGFTTGWTWTPRYGTPGRREELQALLALSPVHRAPPRDLPVTVVAFGERDDHVVPAHGIKLVATLQSASIAAPVLASIGAGSGLRRSPPVVQTDRWADVLSLLRHLLPNR